MKTLISFVVMGTLVGAAHCWSDKGHMVVAQIAWKKLSDAERGRASQMLKKHPHYDEYLSAERPGQCPLDLWVFLRASTWPDWVKKNHPDKYSHGEWHDCNYPFVDPGSNIKLTSDDAPAKKGNLLTQLPVCIDTLTTGSDADKAVYLCWLLHLVGDIHQPLHCVSRFSEQFPKGDDGGQLALVRVYGKPIVLHDFWDALAGIENSVDDAIDDIEELVTAEPNLVKEDLSAHKTFESWAKESFELAKKAGYLKGDLKVAQLKDDPKVEDIPEVPADYCKNARRVARLQLAKAGQRLAEQLRRVLGER